MSKKTKVVSKDTYCKNCIFAMYEGITQQGCHIGQLERALDHDLPLHDCYDEDKEFFVIEDRKCMFERPQEWVKDKGTTIDQWFRAAKNEVRLRFKVIVVCDGETTTEQAVATIHSLAEQYLKPEFVVVIRELNSRVDNRKLMDALAAGHFHWWKVEGLQDTKRRGRYGVDLVLKFKPSPFYAIFRAGNIIPINFLSQIDYLVNQDWLQFGIITNPEDNMDGIVIPHYIYLYFGNSVVDLEKIIGENECQGKKPAILNVKDLVPTFQSFSSSIVNNPT